MQFVDDDECFTEHKGELRCFDDSFFKGVTVVECNENVRGDFGTLDSFVNRMWSVRESEKHALSQ